MANVIYMLVIKHVVGVFFIVASEVGNMFGFLQICLFPSFKDSHACSSSCTPHNQNSPIYSFDPITFLSSRLFIKPTCSTDQQLSSVVEVFLMLSREMSSHIILSNVTSPIFSLLYIWICVLLWKSI